MGNTHDSPAKVAIAGLLAGMLGAVAVSAMVALGRTVMGGSDKPGDPASDAGISAGEALSEGPAMPPDMNRVTAGQDRLQGAADRRARGSSPAA